MSLQRVYTEKDYIKSLFNEKERRLFVVYTMEGEERNKRLLKRVKDIVQKSRKYYNENPPPNEFFGF